MTRKLLLTPIWLRGADGGVMEPDPDAQLIRGRLITAMILANVTAYLVSMK